MQTLILACAFVVAPQDGERLRQLEERLNEVVRKAEDEKKIREEEMAALRQEIENLRGEDPKAGAAPTVNAGFGDIKISGLMQAWLVLKQNDLDNSAVGTGAGGLFDDDDSFRIRRTELNFSGNILEDRLSWGVMVDPSRAIQAGPETAAAQTRRILQDMFIRLHIPQVFDPENEEKWLKVDIGQFKTGLTYEGLMSSSKLDFLERSQLARAFGDVRDIGVKLHGDYDFIAFSGMISNGEGQNTISDLNDAPLYTGRLAFRPFKNGFEGFEDSPLKGLEFGVTAQHGDASVSEADSTGHSQGRFGVHLSWETPKPFFDDDEFIVRAEWMHGRRPNPAAIRGDMEGWYTSASYRFLSDYEFGLRFDHFDPGPVTAAGGAQPFSNINQWTIGFAWYISGDNAKVLANYLISDEPGSGLDLDDDMLVLGFQAAF